MWPEPAEGPGSKSRVDQTIDCGFNRGTPRAAVPDRHLPQGHRVADKRRRSGETEHMQVLRAVGQRAARDVSREDAHHQAIDEPQAQVPAHREGIAWEHSNYHDWSLFELFLELRGFHVLLAGATRHHVVAGRDWPVGGANPSPYLHLGFWDSRL